MSNIIEIETPNNLHYVFFPVTSGTLRFKVKATNDAHIALTHGSFENNPMTELHIGGWDNTHSIVRRDRSEPDPVKVPTYNILNSDEYVGMWIRWYKGVIAAGLEDTETPFMVYHDPEPHPIDHAAVRTGWGSMGSWKIEVSPIIQRPITPKHVGGNVYWIEMNKGDDLPRDAVVGGYENGELIFVARAMHVQSKRPGKYIPSLKHAYVCYEENVHRKNSFEILCGINVAWIKMAHNELPPHAIPGGIAFEQDNKTLHIGRARYNDNLIPGYINLEYTDCIIATSESDWKSIDTFEVLVVPDRCPKQIIWMASEMDRRERERNY